MNNAELSAAILILLKKFNITTTRLLLCEKLSEISEGAPEWWLSNGNKFFADVSVFNGCFPTIVVPPEEQLPENAIVITLSKNIPQITMWGSAPFIWFDSGVSLPGGDIVCGSESAIFLGPDVRSTYSTRMDARNGGVIVLDGDCLIAEDCRFITDDMHAIIDKASGKRINDFGNRIHVRHHVWFGLNCIVWGGARVGSDCVFGARSFVDKSVESGSLALGAPLRVVRSHITWSPHDLKPN